MSLEQQVQENALAISAILDNAKSINDLDNPTRVININEDKIAVYFQDLNKTFKLSVNQLLNGIFDDSVQEFSSFSEFPAIGVSNVIYIDSSFNTLFRWTGTGYISVGALPVNRPVENEYATVADMQADQGNQNTGYLQKVIDASGDPRIGENVVAYYVYMGTSTGVIFTDYDLLTEDQVGGIPQYQVNKTFQVSDVTSSAITEVNSPFVKVKYNDLTNKIESIVFDANFSQYLIGMKDLDDSLGDFSISIFNKTKQKWIGALGLSFSIVNTYYVQVSLGAAEYDVDFVDLDDLLDFSFSSYKSVKADTELVTLYKKGIPNYYEPLSNTSLAYGAALDLAIDDFDEGDYINVKKGIYETRINLIKDLNIHFEIGCVLKSSSVGGVIYNSTDKGQIVNITGYVTIVNDGLSGGTQCIDISNSTYLNIEGDALISDNSVCIRTSDSLLGGSIINANFNDYKSKDGTFDNIDVNSVMNLYGNHATSLGYVLENDGGIINCFIKLIESTGTNPIERASSGSIRIYNSNIFAPDNSPIAINISTDKDDLIFYNCHLKSNLDTPIQGVYKGSFLLNGSLYVDSKLLMNNKPIILSDIAGDIQYITADNGDIEVHSPAYKFKVLTDLGLYVSEVIEVGDDIILNKNGNITALRFYGNGENITDINAALLGGLAASNFVRSTGSVNENINGRKVFLSELTIISKTATWGSQGGFKFKNTSGQSGYIWLDDSNALNIQNSGAVARPINLGFNESPVNIDGPAKAKSFETKDGDGTNVLIDDGTKLPIANIGKSYSEYSIILTQSGTQDPSVINVLENSTGLNFSLIRISAGYYAVEPDNTIDEDKIQIFISQSTTSADSVTWAYFHAFSNRIIIKCRSFNTGSLIDGKLDNTSLSIRIYP